MVSVQQAGGAGEQHTLKYLSPSVWLQNLLVTPTYADAVKSHHDQTQKDMKAQLLRYAQQSRAHVSPIFVRKTRLFVTRTHVQVTLPTQGMF